LWRNAEPESSARFYKSSIKKAGAGKKFEQERWDSVPQPV